MSTTLAKTYTFPTQQIKSYLEREKWSLVNENERWIVFKGNHPVDIALPKDISAPDYHVYVEHALKTLSTATGKTPDSIINGILRYDRDIFGVRIIDNADMSSIPLRLAHRAISGIQELFASATVSEVKEPLPYFPRVRSNPSNILDKVRFGHTFAGSFGYSVESPVNIQESGQMDMFPLQRRVLERIARGLLTADRAAKVQDVEPLLAGYSTGFSANMCDAILSISDNGNSVEIEYSIDWSNEIVVSEDLREIKRFYIQETHLEYLAQASVIMREVHPESVTIEGHIVSLRSPDDPQSDEDIERKVTVEWEQDNGKSRMIVVKLDRHQYNTAIEAHKGNRLISVKGHIYGSERELQWPRNFEVTG